MTFTFSKLSQEESVVPEGPGDTSPWEQEALRAGDGRACSTLPPHFTHFQNRRVSINLKWCQREPLKLIFKLLCHSNPFASPWFSNILLRKEATKKMFCMFPAYLNNVHNYKLPWHKGGVQTSTGQGTVLCERSELPRLHEITHPVLTVMSFKADHWFIIENKVLLLICILIIKVIWIHSRKFGKQVVGTNVFHTCCTINIILLL